MPHYCDTKVLERNWFYWLLGESTPILDRYRQTGLLVSKVLSKATPRADRHPDPFWGYSDDPKRAHCIIIDRPVFCNSYAGRCDSPRHFEGSRPVLCDWPDHTNKRSEAALNKLTNNGYILEQPTQPAWSAILLDIQKICDGISLKFHLKSDDARQDLAAEAFVQVVNKIKHKKLTYTPGLAPVFNLLTTTIHRIIYSLLNRCSRDRAHQAEHANLVLPLVAKGQTRLRGRIVTRRVFGAVVASSYR